MAKRKRVTKSVLTRLYYNLNEPSCYTSAKTLYSTLKSRGYTVNLQQIERFLSKQLAHVLHKRTVNKFKRRSSAGVLYRIGMSVHSDLIDLNTIRQFNDNYAYIFVFIDGFSRFLVCVPTKSKTTDELLSVLERVLVEFKMPCTFLVSDSESALLSRKVQSFLKKIGIRHIVTRNEVKAYMAERVISTIMARVSRYFTSTNSLRWIDIIGKITKAYNNTKHRSLCNGRYAPAQVDAFNAFEIEQFLRRRNTKKFSHQTPTPKLLPVGQHVLITLKRTPFQKGILLQHCFNTKVDNFAF